MYTLVAWGRFHQVAHTFGLYLKSGTVACQGNSLRVVRSIWKSYTMPNGGNSSTDSRESRAKESNFSWDFWSTLPPMDQMKQKPNSSFSVSCSCSSGPSFRLIFWLLPRAGGVRGAGRDGAPHRTPSAMGLPAHSSHPPGGRFRTTVPAGASRFSLEDGPQAFRAPGARGCASTTHPKPPPPLKVPYPPGGAHFLKKKPGANVPSFACHLQTNLPPPSSLRFGKCRSAIDHPKCVGLLSWG